MGKKTPPHPEYPKWTEARYKQFIRSGLRKLWQRWPPRHDKLKNNRVKVEGKKHKYEIQCEHCKEWFPQTYIDVDHIIPAGSSDDWNAFIDRLFVGEDKLALVCRPCHKIKSKSEAQERTKDERET